MIELAEKELRNLVKESLYEIISEYNGYVLNEGVSYDETSDSFTFNFVQDNETNIIPLKKKIYQVSAFGHCYYYAYEFSNNVDSKKRTAFIHSLKFPDGKISQNDKKTFIMNAVDKLDREISLPKYKLLIYPESMSELNRDMLKYLNRFAAPDVISMELVKTLLSKIGFDYARFRMEILDAKLPDGRNRYTEKQKDTVISNIQQMMDEIHSLNYFSIARNVKKNKYRQYINNYYTFKTLQDKKLYKEITRTNVLIIDDIATSGTTISNILNCLRLLNDANNITIFSLIGKEIEIYLRYRNI